MYVPTEEESAFAKRVYNSPRRIEQTEAETFPQECKQQAGPSSMDSSNIGSFSLNFHALLDTFINIFAGLEDFDQEIMAQVLAESQKTYLDELKHKSKKRNGSPGPSTSS